MLVIYDGNELCKAPNSLSVGDTIIFNNNIYSISSKTYDFDSDELYCKVTFFEESDNETLNKILTELYGSEVFTSSGSNTNSIEGNPKLIMLLIVGAVIIDDEHFKENCAHYKSNIIQLWGNKTIKWLSIFDNHVKIKLSDIEKIKSACCELFTAYKISQSIWPFTSSKLQNE